MAGTKRGMPFERTGPFPIDDTLVLSKTQMLAVSDAKMPEKYFAVCTDDGKLYVYDKSATASLETGKFSVVTGEEIPINTALISWNNTTREEPTSVRIAHKTGPNLARTDFTDVQNGVSVELRTPLSNTTKVLASKEYVDSIIPSDGEEGQILTKVSETGAEWGVDTGAELVKYGRQYGMMPDSTPITAKSATVTSSSVIIPIGGCITNFDSFGNGMLENFDAYVTWRGSEYKVTGKSQTVHGWNFVFTPGYYWEASQDSGGFPNVFNKVTTGSMQQQGLTAVRFVAKGNNNFGVSDGTTPYDIRNLTGMVLDDLKVTGNAIPTDWGVAGIGTVALTGTAGSIAVAPIDVSGYGFASVNDYYVLCEPVGGNSYGDTNTYIQESSKTATSVTVGAVLGRNCDRVVIAYTIFAKGYGNNRMGGGAGLPSGGTTGQVLSKASNADGDVTWRTPSGGSGLAPEMTWDDQQDLMGLANGNNVLSFRDTGDGVNVGITRPGEYLGGGELAKKGYVDTALATKQDELVSGTNIKTVNGNSLLGSGDIQISGSGVPSYEVSNNDNGGNVVKVGEYVENGVTYGIYEFYYKTGALPNTTTKVFSLATLLADYTILDFMDVHGITSNGIYIGSGRIDGTNIVVVQQFSKNNKTFTVRSYQDFSGATARVCIKFIGTKNA